MDKQSRTATRHDIDKIATCLENGGAILIPTDTVYGLAVSANHNTAIEKIYALKARPRDRFLPIMVASVKDLEPLGLSINKKARMLFSSNLVPGALTIALGFIDQPLVPWLAGREEVAIRIPDDDRILGIIRKVGPLLMTSANRHGSAKTPDNVTDILEELEGKPDMVIEGKVGKEKPSTIINCRLESPVIERMGDISEESIFKVLNNG